MNKGKCKNCGGDKGIHQWDTLQCPFGGREAPFPRQTEYMELRYAEDTEMKDETIRALSAQNAELVKALEAINVLELAGNCCGCSEDDSFDEVKRIASEALESAKKGGTK